VTAAAVTVNTVTRFASLLITAALVLAVGSLGCGSPPTHHPPEPAVSAAKAPLTPITTNRHYEVIASDLNPADHRALLHYAGQLLGDWQIHLSGVAFNGPLLIALSETPTREPLLRAIRESFGRAIDLPDFLYFLDDVLKAGEEGRRGEGFYVTPSRARSAGILVHPDDVFFERPRHYGDKASIAVDRPRRQAEYPAALDSEPLGPNWSMRFRNPASEEAMLAALEASRPDSQFAERIRLLVDQLRQQGAEVLLNSTLRSPKRGYLMWGAFLLSRAANDAASLEALKRLEDANRDWELDVPIQWAHPEGLAATREAARLMADAYEVVYATEAGARASRHYAGVAADLQSHNLPRSLTLVSPGGETAHFDLSDSSETRDLSLTPRLIHWIEEHFEFAKLRSDYPHWDDARVSAKESAGR
jgi:hypothetical protein